MKPPHILPRLLFRFVLYQIVLLSFIRTVSTQGRFRVTPRAYYPQVDYAGYRTYYGRPRPDSRCVSILRDQEGWLFSPNYPLNYGNYQACSYIIQRYSRHVCQAEITLVDFELEDSNSCYADYFDLSKEKICGTLDSDTKKIVAFPTNGRPLILRFRSDGQNTYKGFTIRVYQIPHSCGRQRDIDSPRHPSRRSCDEEISATAGRITSPGFPSRYGSNQRCTFTIRRANFRVCRLELDFHRFDLEYGDSCRNDYLQLPDDTRLCGTISGTKSLSFPSDKDHLTLSFYSDRYGSGHGFDIDIRQATTSCQYDIRSGQQPPPPPEDARGCHQQIRENTGRFTSPGYPGNFGPNEHCVFTLWRADASVCKAELDFQYFDLGYGDGSCSRASFELPDHTLVCHPFSGRKTIDISKDSDHISFTFVTGRHSYGRGFDIYITQITGSCGHYNEPRGVSNGDIYPGCHQTITTYYGRFTSPPPSRLRNEAGCSFVIKKADPFVCGAEINFLRFDLGILESYCTNDYLVLPNGQKLCGRISGTRYLSFPPTSDAIVISYYSDYNGGTMELEVIQDRGCYTSTSRSRRRKRIMPRSLSLPT